MGPVRETISRVLSRSNLPKVFGAIGRRVVLGPDFASCKVFADLGHENTNHLQTSWFSHYIAVSIIWGSLLYKDPYFLRFRLGPLIFGNFHIVAGLPTFPKMGETSKRPKLQSEAWYRADRSYRL